MLACEEDGRALAPVPLAGHLMAARLLVRVWPNHPDTVYAARSEEILSIATVSADAGGPQLAPAGAVASECSPCTPAISCSSAARRLRRTSPTTRRSRLPDGDPAISRPR
ncbi:hypothetical protein GCM10009836_25020 [Pseudonocardia ailaonensis]|uniref:Uncharacterized protein n=1 Tax=Pseudonocardia ailaonensis TaxID=367279 RepID=A0ABN2N1M3_9PSEU